MVYKHKNEDYFFDNVPINSLWKKYNRLIILRGTNAVTGQAVLVTKEYGINIQEPYTLDSTLVISEEYFNKNFKRVH